MSAQEFSSPGAHMASQSSGSSGYHSTGIIYSGNSGNNVSFNPPIYYGDINNSFDNSRYLSSARNYMRMADRFNKKYMDYNDSLFNSAKEYDMYMSNTAIQRQVEDLKKAGLNPILATRLGGAQYKGVNAPYLSIQPSSALNSFLDYDATINTNALTNETNRDIAELNNNTNKFISSYNKTMDRIIKGDEHLYGRDLINLQHECNILLENIKKFNTKDIMSFGFNGQNGVNNFQNELNKDFNSFATSTKLSADKEMSDYKYSLDTNEGFFNWVSLATQLAANVSNQRTYNIYSGYGYGF